MRDANRVFENSKECSNAFQSVQKHRLQNPKNIVIGHLNFNSLRNKFEAVEELVQNKVGICFLSEIKINETFPNPQFMVNGYKLFCRDRNCYGGGVLCQFMVNGYKLFCRDRNCYGGGVLCYVNENISFKTVNVEGIVKECEIVLIEFSIKTCKWIFIGLYKLLS